MRSPLAALSWELWQRNRQRLILLLGLPAGFALIYPALCAQAGFDLSAPDALESFVQMVRGRGSSGLVAVMHVLYGMGLLLGPIGAMLVSLLCLVWMSTLTSFDMARKGAMPFPDRLLNLPVSTPFLFWWLVLAGQGAIILLYSGWHYFVRFPHLELFGAYTKCFGWMTFTVLAQGLAWALAAWPNTRAILAAVLLACFCFSPASHIFDSSFLLPPLFVAGIGLARLGLEKMRHGEWRGVNWDQVAAAMFPRRDLQGPKRFASPAQAQAWFEWRRFARRLCFIAAVAAIIPLLLKCTSLLFNLGPLDPNTIGGVALCLCGIPPVLHYCFACSPGRRDTGFIFNRPITNGQIVMAVLKAAAVSTVICWAIIVAVLPVLLSLEDIRHAVAISDHHWLPLILLSVLLTWRFVAVGLGFAMSGHKRLIGIPALSTAVVSFSAICLVILSDNKPYWDAFSRMLPWLLAALLLLKVVLTVVLFRVSLARRLLAVSSVINYLTVWTLLSVIGVVVVLNTTWFNGAILPGILAVVLLVPIARVALSPILVGWNRHG